jgi:hypothetical protein
MEFQHINVKLFVKNAEEVELASLIPVFHSWIQNQANGELLLDVADYRHVHAGPGLVLIGHQGNYSLDNAGNRLGVRYNCKAVLQGTNQDRLVQATQAALAACQRLESDSSLGGMIQFDGREMEVSINDRLLAPNRPQTRAAAESELRTFFSTLFGDIDYAVSYPQDPRSLFSVHVKTSQAFDATVLLNNLNEMAPASCQS